MNNFLNLKPSRDALRQLIYYGLVGIATNTIGYFLYLLITYCGGTPKLTMSILYITGALMGFWGNRKLTFAHQGGLLATGVRFAIAHTLGYGLNLAILIVMVDEFYYPHQAVQAAAIFIVAGFLFLAFKFFVFANKPHSKDG